MKQVIIKKGGVEVQLVPAPVCQPGCVLVEVAYSCISIGTEMSSMNTSDLPLWKRALSQPDNLKKVLQMAATTGIAKTRSVIQAQLSAGNATGYSASGRVVSVGEGIRDLKTGDLVACAGAEYAHHAEYICVPRNLAVSVPNAVSLDKASTVTVGAIALQGVRRLGPTLGEYIVVLGLGLLGQLSVQILKANGCYVIGIDLDAKRLALAKENGADYVFSPIDQSTPPQVARLTQEYGADGVVITAAGQDEEILASAFQMTRKKGRVVLVGDVPMHIKREDIYKKELDFYISTSYGPGRYDNRYEEEGMDYPIAHVRWTENRNMQAYLQLLSSEKIKLSNLIEAVYPIEKADEAYSNIKTQNPKPLMVLLQYDVESSKKAIHFMRVNKTVPELGARPSLAVIGSGGFAKAVHLPNLLAMRGNIRLAAIVSKSGHNAKSTASQFGADYATTDYQRVLNDNTINSVMITTRHDSHASLVLEALQAGKNVFVEKPLALSRGEVELIQSYYSQGERYNLLMVGYNRRFSKYAKAIKKHLLSRINPMIINYRMNVGYIPSDHWLQGKEGGGRNLGEACHIYDLFNYFTDAQVVSVEAKSISPSTSYYFKNDNFTTVIEYADGSICNLIYTALGDTSYPKEIMEVYFDGKIFIMEDYCALKSFGIEKTEIQSNFPEKGHIEEINSFFDAINNGKEWPIPFWQIIQASEIAFQVEEKIQEKRGKLVKKIENLKEEDKTICISELEILV